MITRRSLGLAAPAIVGAAALGIRPVRAAEDWRKQYPTIAFGVITSENAADRIKRYKLAQDYLSNALGVQIAWRQATDYAGIIQGIISHKIQLANFGPASFSKAYILSHGQVTPIVEELDQFGNKGYYSVMVVRKDSGYDKVADLKGKVYAFADPNSTSGFQAPTYFLTKQGYPPNKFFGKTVFSGSHENSIMALYHKSVDGCSTWWNNPQRSNITRMEEKGMIPKGWWKIIWKTPQLPSDPWAMPTWLPQRMRDDVQKVVMDMPKKNKPAFDAIFDGQSTGFAPGNIDDYKPIIEIVKYNAEHHLGE